MILEFIFNLVKKLLFICFGWINLPEFPSALSDILDKFLDIIFGGINLLGFFIGSTFIKIAIPVLIIVINFDKLYKLTMFILRKIPFLNIK